MDERGFPAALPVLADVKNRAKMRQVFEAYRPSVVFHAAAYKHVPLIESNPVEAVRNNTLATRTVAEVAVEFGADRFVLISTDKAVNAKTVMGQSKAVCEWIVEAFGHRDDVSTRFVAVRFGNVLGSSGSVIPIFRRQIAKGGPLTLTHPEMTRYFMTIPEAVQLVVQAGAIGGRGRVFVLDMGEPVSILEPREDDPPLREGARADIADRGGRRPAGREAARGALDGGRRRHPERAPAIMQLARPPIDSVWLESELQELQRLVGGRRDAGARRPPRGAGAGRRAASEPSRRAPRPAAAPASKSV